MAPAKTIPVVEELKALTTDQPQNPLRPNQIKAFQEEMDRQTAMATAPAWVEGHSRGRARERARELGRLLDAQAPKPITGPRNDAVRHKVQEVLEKVIQPGMPTRAEMRRNPPGVVGRILRTEFNPVFKDAVLTVKRAMHGVDLDGEAASDPDYTNMERFRREGTGDGTASFMADGQIPGVFAWSPQAKANWPLPDPPTSAIAQVQQREARERTPAQEAATARMKAARRAKIEARRTTAAG